MMACSSMVRAVALYAKGCWFESISHHKLYELRFNSMEEDHRYKVKVVSSNLTVATKWLVAQLDRCSRLLSADGGCEFESHRANNMFLHELIRSIMEVHWFSKPTGKSSNLFGSTYILVIA